MGWRRRWMIGAVAVAAVLGACASERKVPSTEGATTSAAPAGGGGGTAAPAGGGSPSSEPGASETSGAPAAGDQGRPDQFGDLDWPCGPGDGDNADDGSVTGVTKDSVRIAAGDDAGAEGSGGLNHEMTDAMKAMVAHCNELGGINGRQITLDYYDAGIVNVTSAIQAACDEKNFFLVGEGWALDANQEEIRQGCGLPAVPTYTVSAAFAMAADVFSAVPNPADEFPAGGFAMLADLFPDAVDAVATLGGNFSATQETVDKARVTAPQFGWQFLPTKYEYDIFTVVQDWTPLAKQIADARATMIYWSGTCLPNLQKFAQTARQNGLDVPIVTEGDHYSAACAAANTDGSLDKLYIRFAYVPLEEAAENKATRDYIELVKASGGDISLLGMQATSAFLYWATAAQRCGATLTRECVLANLAAIHTWTGGGLHAPTDPGANHPPACSAILNLHGTEYVRVAPKEPATFDCDPSWVVKVVGVPALDALHLDANRHPQSN